MTNKQPADAAKIEIPESEILDAAISNPHPPSDLMSGTKMFATLRRFNNDARPKLTSSRKVVKQRVAMMPPRMPNEPPKQFGFHEKVDYVINFFGCVCAAGLIVIFGSMVIDNNAIDAPQSVTSQKGLNAIYDDDIPQQRDESADPDHVRLHWDEVCSTPGMEYISRCIIDPKNPQDVKIFNDSDVNWNTTNSTLRDRRRDPGHYF